MRKIAITALLFGLFTIFALPTFAQDDTETSPGCLALDGFTSDGTAFAFDANTFNAGEVIIIADPNGEAEFIVSESGTPLTPTEEVSGVFIYAIPAAGEYAFSVEVAEGSEATSFQSYCLETGVEIDTTYTTGGEICHRPPGNPDNAHTINVGPGAIQAHLAHGDTLGPCPDGIDTRVDDAEAGLSVFFYDSYDQVQIYGDCTDDSCSLVLLLDITLLVAESGFEIEFEEYDDDDDDDDDEVEDTTEYSAVIYYLHPFPDTDVEVNVFQINIYLNDTLQSDNTLLILDEDGEIIAWTDQNVWEDLEGFRIAFDLD